MTDRSTTILDIKDLRSGYGAAETIQGVSLAVRAGEVVGLAGRNGVGKTTLAKTIVGLVRAHAGTIELDGVPIHKLSPAMRAAHGVGYVPQGRKIFDMSVRDNLRLGVRVGKRSLAHGQQLDMDAVYRMFPVLEKYRHRNGQSLSGGEQQMLAIARVLVGRPRLLILDEPSEGIQPSIVAEIGRAAVRLAGELGIGVILIEQNVDLLVASAGRILVLEKGSIIAEMADVAPSHSTEIAKYLAL